MCGKQVDGFGIWTVENRILPYEGQLGGKNGIVKIEVLVGVNGDVKYCVIGTSCFVDDSESIRDYSIAD